MISRKTPLPNRKKPLKRLVRPKKIAEKRQLQITQYNIERLAYLADHPGCEICSLILDFKNKHPGYAASWWPVCSKKAVEIHHKSGRENMLLLASDTFMASCCSKGGKPNGHNWIKENPAASLLIGIINRRNF